MRRLILGAIYCVTIFVICAGAISQHSPSNQKPASDKYQWGAKYQNSAQQPKSPSIFDFFSPSGLQNISEYCARKPDNEPDKWLHEKFVCDVHITDVVIAVFTVLLVVVTILLWWVARDQALTIVRQMRAYVGVESCTVLNVANPPAHYVGVPNPNPAAINNPRVGPWARITIKNAGQSPAYEVEHWGYCRFADYPLPANTKLLKQKGGVRIGKSVLGPGINSTKMISVPAPLAPAEIAKLFSGTGAIYFWGEILYRDAWGKTRFTNYRLMHHWMGGAIGVSTDLTFCEEGNEADKGDRPILTRVFLEIVRLSGVK